MGRFRGLIGFVQTVETSPGVYEEVPTEKTYSGDIIRESRSWVKDGQVNDDLRITNRFSIVSDEFLMDNFKFMRYVRWMNEAWKISNVDIQRPRIILSIGEVYNG